MSLFPKPFSILSAFFALFLPITARAEIDKAIDQAVSPLAEILGKWVFVSVPLFGSDIKIVVAVLIGASIFCTIYFKFINIRGFKHAIDIVSGKTPESSQPGAPGEVSHFQALTTACGATVGLGNIAGVAIAVSQGGPGAAFWMMVAGLFGMSLKFCECTLGVKYRKENPDGSVSGGPMYYLSRGFEEMGMKKLGKVLASLFAVFCVGGAIGAGCLFQANQSFTQFSEISGGGATSGWIFGVVVAIVLGLVIIGGIKQIGRVTSKIVPFMAIVYVGAALVIIGLRFDQVPEALSLIFHGAFTPEGVEGGALGVMIWGFQRAAFSNEAGLGSAAIAHSTVKTNYPATEGLVSLLEPFLDTVVICSITALVIVLTGTYQITDGGMAGIEITSAAFASSISWFPYVLAFAAILFAFSSMISWSYYGLKSWTFLFGETESNKLTFNAIFCVCVAIGSAISLSSVISLSDALIFLMAFVNMIGIFAMINKVKGELKTYKDSTNGF
ncbi:MAG: amino acid carrier protein [Candidatus Mycalebacterium zealandia]|nr:MAG: amino acid carrier protein [Candidatus Mycalebacterium zealandia]